MKTNAKKLIPVAIIALLAIAAWYAILGHDGMTINIDGDDYNGPMGAVLGVLFAGGGLLIAAVVVTCVAVFIGVLYAGLGILMVVGLALLALVLTAAISPLMLPLLIPVGIYWIFSARSRKQRARAQLEHAV